MEKIRKEETKQMAQDLANKGIKIYTVGVGTEKGAPIPMRVGNSMIGYKKDNKGETVITQRKPEILEGIADAANGTYIDGNVTEKPVKEISDIIATAQKSEFETKQFSDYKDQFQWFLGIALLVLLLDIFLFDKKTKWLRKIDLFNEEKAKK